jgi:hypothetical protein
MTATAYERPSTTPWVRARISDVQTGLIDLGLPGRTAENGRSLSWTLDGRLVAVLRQDIGETFVLDLRTPTGTVRFDAVPPRTMAAMIAGALRPMLAD